jgi:ubiquinone biosynthesis protein COQ9
MRKKIVLKLISLENFPGWDEKLLYAALENPPSLLKWSVLFPHKEESLMAAFLDLLKETITALELSDTLKTHQKIMCVLKSHFDDWYAYRDAVRALFIRKHVIGNTKIAFDFADTIWNKVNDTSTDMNWYTKRGILCGIFMSCLSYWLFSGPSKKELLDYAEKHIFTVSKRMSSLKLVPAELFRQAQILFSFFGK